MKSAYDLAMERFGDEPIKKLTNKQKQDITEIDSICQSKIAEAQVMNQTNLKKAGGDLDKIRQIKDDLVVELASLNEKYEGKKERIRNESD